MRTSSGLWRRRPQAHVVPAVLATPRTSPESLAPIDPMVIRAQVAGGMRGLRAVSVTLLFPQLLTLTGKR
ncbi:hypothetical protein DRA43_00585 [Micromonospora provocatoris]|nr:hypothetical protein DRA43_00585 [Micromonospora provocatoris]